MAPMQIAVIGAGPSGIFTLRAFKSLVESGEVNIVAFEKQSKFGGQWNYSDETGKDRWGETVPGSMYRNLWINGPAEAIEVPDLPFVDVPSYVPRETITEWWSKYVKEFGLLELMELNTRVNKVEYDEAKKKFTVETQQFGGKPVVRNFDYVIVCSGHFSFPNDPYFEGIETFPGKVLHAHDFRDGAHFKDERVLCIGGSYSAEDLAMQCWKFGAKSATVTCRRPIGYDWPKGMSERPILTKINGKTVTFADGASDEFDAIIKCTGYKHHFPFLADDLQLVTANTLSIPLYRQTVHPNNNKLLFVGMMDQYFTFQMFWAQAYFCAKIVTGRVDLPSKEAMIFDIESEKSLEASLKSCADKVDFQARHTNYFTEVAGLQNVDIGYILKSWLEDKKEKPTGIVGFRDKMYKSHFTHVESPPTGWAATFEKK